VLPVTTEQKASSPSPVRSERHVHEPRWDRGLIFGLIRLRSPTFIGVRINAAMQVADLNGIRRTIIQTPENRKVGPGQRGAGRVGSKTADRALRRLSPVVGFQETLPLHHLL
jgi:hypothetical protein